jgi:hypothetical protein
MNRLLGGADRRELLQLFSTTYAPVAPGAAELEISRLGFVSTGPKPPSCKLI